MRLILAQGFLLLAVAAAQTGSADWQTATELPNVDMAGLTAVQKRAALKVLREQACICSCDMKVAECRMKDSSCGDSRALAEVIVKAIREGKNPEKAVADSDVVKRKSASPTLLEAAIPLPISGAPGKGPANARITLVEFSDFECPYCTKAVARLETILKAYPKDARLVYKQYPLSSHPHARAAAEASVAAQAQDKFWPMYDKLFANSTRLSDGAILGLAKEAGLDIARFQADWKSTKVKQVVDKDIEDGGKVSITGTPTIFINGKRYNGPLDMAVLKPVLDAELKAKK
jgi:protein-disulfide isomerase